MHFAKQGDATSNDPVRRNPGANVMMFVRLFCQNSTFKRKPNQFFHYTALILTVFILLNNEEQRKDLVIILGFQFIPTTILQCRCSTPSSHPTRSPARYLRKTQTERENTSLLTKAVPLKERTTYGDGNVHALTHRTPFM